MFTQLYNKCLKLAAHKNSNYFLGVISFIESSFFPIPPDVMIAPMAIAKKKDFLRIFLIATIFSVLGGIFGYVLGAFDHTAEKAMKSFVITRGDGIAGRSHIAMMHQ